VRSGDEDVRHGPDAVGRGHAIVARDPVTPADRRTDAPGPEDDQSVPGSSAILTIPNLLSVLRIVLIPVFVALLVHHGTELAGLVLVGVVMATDWVDGYIARRTNTVSELGKLLDPTSDRLAIAAAIVALVVRHAFPLWAALLILVRDAGVFLVGALLLGSKARRLDVRFIGKVGTFVLMCSVPMIAWGNFDLPLGPTFTAIGWIFFPIGIAEYYVATALYVGDIRALYRANA
jgi:cardiolipin synthase (CMP-forming)